MSTRWHVLTHISFPPQPPINCFFIHQPTSFPKVLISAPHLLSVLIGGWGGWCYFHFPLTHIHLLCLYHPISHQYDWISLHCILRRSCGSLPPSSAGCRYLRSFPSILRSIPITAPVEFSLLSQVEGDPAYPDVAHNILPNLFLQGRMWTRTGPDAISLWVEAQSDLPTILQQGLAKVFWTCCRRHLS